MRVSLDPKTFAYYKRVAPEFETLSTAVMREKLGFGGEMTRKVVLAELARREGAVIIKTRSH